MFMWFAKTTFGGQPAEEGGTSPGATIVFSPMIDKVVAKVDIKDAEGSAQ